MSNQIELRFTGALAPDNMITARTLSHSLGHFQRAIDKIVIYETRGNLRKYSTLAANQYHLADLVVLPFEEGSIKIPLINDTTDYLASRLRQILQEPYAQAARNTDRNNSGLPGQVEAAVNRAHYRNPAVNTHEHLIQNPEIAEREYIKAAALGDMNNLLSILRSKSITERETIRITARDDQHVGVYEFNQQTSKSFNQIVRSRTLGPEVVYTGILEGLERTNTSGFPYSGKFVSAQTQLEMKLWVPSDEAALALNPHNLSSVPFSFWGTPVMVYGTFDAMRGDIVFLDFVR